MRLLLWAGTAPRLRAHYAIISTRHIKVLCHFVTQTTTILRSLPYLHHIWEPALFLVSSWFALHLWFSTRQGSSFAVFYKTMLCVHHNASSCSTQGENNRTSSQLHYYNISLHNQGTKQWGPFHQANCLCVRREQTFSSISQLPSLYS